MVGVIPPLYHYTTSDTTEIDLSEEYEQCPWEITEGLFCSTRGGPHSWHTWRNQNDDNPGEQLDMKRIFRIHLKEDHGLLVVDSQKAADELAEIRDTITGDPITLNSWDVIHRYKGYYIPHGLKEPWDSFIDVCCIWDLSAIQSVEEVTS